MAKFLHNHCYNYLTSFLTDRYTIIMNGLIMASCAHLLKVHVFHININFVPKIINYHAPIALLTVDSYSLPLIVLKKQLHHYRMRTVHILLKHIMALRV